MSDELPVSLGHEEHPLFGRLSLALGQVTFFAGNFPPNELKIPQVLLIFWSLLSNIIQELILELHAHVDRIRNDCLLHKLVIFRDLLTPYLVTHLVVHGRLKSEERRFKGDFARRWVVVVGR